MKKRLILFLVLTFSVSIFSNSNNEKIEDIKTEQKSEKQGVLPPNVVNGVYVKPDKKVIMEKLTDLQFLVTQKNSTESPFNNMYWDNHSHGIYVDVVSGEPLFSSTDKYESGTGWPSFTKPLERGNIIELTDSSHGMVRVEVRSLYADSHLGHLFPDGPAPTGDRYCINSASLRFIPVEDMVKEGYENYMYLFEEL